MNRRYLFPILAAAAVIAAAVFVQNFARAQDDVSTRGEFLKSRPKLKADKPAPDSRPSKKSSSDKPAVTSPMGLGYTLFQRDAGGRAVRVPTSREFRSGDRVRLQIESNSDGYLYVFNTVDGADATMIFPDARLGGGNNFVRAHVPHEIPSSREPNPQHRWFEFDANPGAERLYLVFSREPLPDVLIGDRLVAHCKSSPQQCPWRPSDATWNPVARGADVVARVEQSQDAGKEITSDEVEATSRGIGLPSSAPAPSVVKISSSANAGKVTLIVDLVHK